MVCYTLLKWSSEIFHFCTLNLLIQKCIIAFSDISIKNSQLNFEHDGESQCTNVSVTSDGILEDMESHCLTLESIDSSVIVGQSSVTCISVEDNDTVVVEWEQSMYSATEGNNISICAMQWNASEISFTVNISIPVTATGGKQLSKLL